MKRRLSVYIISLLMTLSSWYCSTARREGGVFGSVPCAYHFRLPAKVCSQQPQRCRFLRYFQVSLCQQAPYGGSGELYVAYDDSLQSNGIILMSETGQNDVVNWSQDPTDEEIRSLAEGAATWVRKQLIRQQEL